MTDFKDLFQSKNLFKFREDTKENFTEGGSFVAHHIFYGLFKSPYVLWRMSCKYLRNLRNEASLDIEKIDNPWPFITFWVRFIFKFLFHALIFISVVIAPIAATCAAIMNFTVSVFENPIGCLLSSWMVFIGTFALFYYAPIAIRLTIELAAILVKVGPYIIKLLYSPIKFIIKLVISIFGIISNILSAIYNFFNYLSNKGKYKAGKYEKRYNDINKS